MSKNLYMVPYDFTEIGEKALQYALKIGKNVSIEILVVHIAKDESDKKKKEIKLNEVVSKIDPPNECEISTLVKIGHFISDLGKIASEEKVQLVIMGTHGSIGMQKIMGSHAMKIITSAECPFLVVQEKTQINPVQNILVPIDLTKESLQIVPIAVDMAQIMGSELTITAEKQTDPLLASRLKNRLGIVKEKIEEEGIDPKIKLFEEKGAFDRKIIKYSESNQMDMIAFAYHSESIFAVLDTFAQKLITNKQGLPALVLNSKQASALYF